MPRIKKANPNNPDYIDYLYPTSDTPDYIKYKNAPDYNRPYGYYVGTPDEAKRNTDMWNKSQSMSIKPPKTPRKMSANPYIKQDAWTPEYVTNRAYGSMRSDPVLAELMNLYNLVSNGVSSGVDAVSSGVNELSNQYDRLNRLLTRNGYNNTTGRPRSEVTPPYIFYPNEQMNQYDTVQRRKTRDNYNNTTGRPKSEVTPDYIFSNPVSKRKKSTKKRKY